MNNSLVACGLAALLALLAGCGGGMASGGMAVTSSSSSASPGIAADSYTQAVFAIAATSSESTSPVPTEGITATAADAGGPVALN